MKKICVMGLGYIGLPTSAVLADYGYHVYGVRTNQSAADALNRGEVQISEPGLTEIVKKAVQNGRFHAGTVPAEADVFIIAVPTPFTDGHRPDLSYVEAATRSIAPYIRGGNMIVLESTVPVKTTEKIADWLREMRPDLDIPVRTDFSSKADICSNSVYIAHSPERVLPGRIIEELVENDRVIGGINKVSADLAGDFYRTFVRGEVLLTDARTAELCKLVENSFRDVNIAFANELSILCDVLEIDVWHLIELANHHPRVRILQPGPGVGGHCIAVDPWFIVDELPQEARLIRTAREINDSKPDYVIDKIARLAARIKDPVVTCLGLSFKPDVDDLRESPAMEIVERLAEKNIGKLIIVDPFQNSLPSIIEKLPNTVFYEDIDSAVHDADIVVMLVNHRQFSSIDPCLLQEKVLVDTRGVWRGLECKHFCQ